MPSPSDPRWTVAAQDGHAAAAQLVIHHRLAKSYTRAQHRRDLAEELLTPYVRRPGQRSGRWAAPTRAGTVVAALLVVGAVGTIVAITVSSVVGSGPGQVGNAAAMWAAVAVVGVVVASWSASLLGRDLAQRLIWQSAARALPSAQHDPQRLVQQVMIAHQRLGARLRRRLAVIATLATAVAAGAAWFAAGALAEPPSRVWALGGTLSICAVLLPVCLALVVIDSTDPAGRYIESARRHEARAQRAYLRAAATLDREAVALDAGSTSRLTFTLDDLTAVAEPDLVASDAEGAFDATPDDPHGNSDVGNVVRFRREGG